ncbi:MAG TPA: RDD family protein [Candidatus Acidoferrum sp.]|jgi:uncharacterized RDD family membrane protein YckC|nr:RDD family protein [Candidatus Acidoferrum sp.]
MSSVDKLTIETPEQTLLEFPLAGIGSRFLAIALDTLLQFAAYIVLGLIAALLSTEGFLPTLGKQWGVAIVIFLAFVVQFGYYTTFEALWNGQTPGKRWTHLRVIQDSGRPISAYDAILRNLLRIVDSLPTLYGVGIVTILLSRENKRVGDYAAGTVVVHEKPLQGVGSIWSDAAAPATATPQIPAVSMSVDELRLVETFFERRASLDPDVRRSMARQIAQRLGERMNVPVEVRPDSEKFLEALAEQRRSSARFH